HHPEENNAAPVRPARTEAQDRAVGAVHPSEGRPGPVHPAPKESPPEPCPSRDDRRDRHVPYDHDSRGSYDHGLRDSSDHGPHAPHGPSGHYGPFAHGPHGRYGPSDHDSCGSSGRDRYGPPDHGSRGPSAHGPRESEVSVPAPGRPSGDAGCREEESLPRPERNSHLWVRSRQYGLGGRASDPTDDLLFLGDQGRAHHRPRARPHLQPSTPDASHGATSVVRAPPS